MIKEIEIKHEVDYWSDISLGMSSLIEKSISKIIEWPPTADSEEAKCIQSAIAFKEELDYLLIKKGGKNGNT